MHVISGLATGGAEMMLLKVLQRSDPRRFVHAVVALFGTGPIADQVRKLQLPLLEVSPDRSLARLATMPKALAVVRQFRPHVLQGWMYHGNLLATVARMAVARSAGLLWNVRQTLYGMEQEKLLTRQVIRAGARLSTRADTIIYNSALSRDQHWAVGYEHRHSVVVPNGFDLQRFAPDRAALEQTRRSLGMTATDFVIGCVARYHPMKDHATLLRACARLGRLPANVCLMLVGEGCEPGNVRLAQLIRDLQLQGRVHLLGQRAELTALYAAMDVHCLSSRWGEGFPNVVGEAMACGVPNVVTDIGECRTLVGDTGVVCRAGDDELLAQALGSMLERGPEARHELGVRARARIAQRYEIAHVVGAYDSLYASAVPTGTAR